MTYMAEFDIRALNVTFYIEMHGQLSDCKSAAIFIAAHTGARFTGVLEPVEKPNDR